MIPQATTTTSQNQMIIKKEEMDEDIIHKRSILGDVKGREELRQDPFQKLMLDEDDQKKRRNMVDDDMRSDEFSISSHQPSPYFHPHQLPQTSYSPHQNDDLSSGEGDEILQFVTSHNNNNQQPSTSNNQFDDNEISTFVSSNHSFLLK